MIKSNDLTEARLWDESVCLDCGEKGEEGEPCPACGGEDVYHVSVIDAVLEKVEVNDE